MKIVQTLAGVLAALITAATVQAAWIPTSEGNQKAVANYKTGNLTSTINANRTLLCGRYETYVRLVADLFERGAQPESSQYLCALANSGGNILDKTGKPVAQWGAVLEAINTRQLTWQDAITKFNMPEFMMQLHPPFLSMLNSKAELDHTRNNGVFLNQEFAANECSSNVINLAKQIEQKTGCKPPFIFD